MMTPAERGLRKHCQQMAGELGQADFLIKHLVAGTVDAYVRREAAEWLARAAVRLGSPDRSGQMAG